MSATWSPSSPDVKTLLEAIYAFEDTDATNWLERIGTALAPSITGNMGVQLVLTTANSKGSEFLAVVPREFRTADAVSAASELKTSRTINALPPVSFAGAVIDAGITAGLPALVEAGLMPAMPKDIFFLNGGDDDGRATISALLDKRGALSVAQSEPWSKVVAHLGAAARLRVQGLPTADIRIDPTRFSVVDAHGAANDRSARDALRTAARAIDRVRGRRVPDAEEALALWRVLTLKRWTIADEFDRAGRRYVVAYENVPRPRLQLPKLTLGERQTVCFAALGHSNKHIAYELGISTSTVASRLSSAMKKLGVRSRAKLIEAVVASPVESSS